VNASVAARAAVSRMTRVASAESPAGREAAILRSRSRLVDSSVVMAEDLRCDGPQGRTPEGFSPDFQICLPYRGLFVWHVRTDEVVADPNQVLFVSGGEAFSLTQPRGRCYAELIITPCAETLAEIMHTSGARLAFHPLFRRRSFRASPPLQRLRSEFLARSASEGVDELHREEAALALLRVSVTVESRRNELAVRTRRLVGRAKEYLEANLACQIRLVDVARAVGASPAYLTNVFSQLEGVALHRYLMQLRLARALVELPHTDDLTGLAFDLGFSSHSHFTAAFRRAFHCTPSQYRAENRSRVGRRAAAALACRLVS